MRITTTQQLLTLLDELFGDGTDWTSRDAAEHWANVFSDERHPHNSDDLPDASLLLWAQQRLLGALAVKTQPHTAFDIGCGLGATAGRSLIQTALRRMHTSALYFMPSTVSGADIRRRA